MAQPWDVRGAAAGPTRAVGLRGESPPSRVCRPVGKIPVPRRRSTATVPLERPPTLLSAAPVLAALDEIDQQLRSLRALAPSSDATVALAQCHTILIDAIGRATAAHLVLSVHEAAGILGRSASVVARCCRTETIAAAKVGGVWQIGRSELEQCVSAGACK